MEDRVLASAELRVVYSRADGTSGPGTSSTQRALN